MQIIDARCLDTEAATENCGVCIIGAGAAGLYLGVRLAQSGMDVIILEAGGRVGGDGGSVGIDCAFEGEPYRGASEGRFFGLGGSTSRWGGALVPHSELDIRPARAGGFDPWRHIVTVVEERTAQVLQTLGLDVQHDDRATPRRFFGSTAARLRSRGLEISMARYLPFRRKNLAFLLKRSCGGAGRLRVFLHTVAVDWQIGAGAESDVRIKRVTARSGKRAMTVFARSFVLAAGAIESTRILLEIQRQAGSASFCRGTPLGCYLGDHLSCRIAEVPSGQSALAAGLFGPRFSRGWMRTVRFVERSAPAGSPRCFAHFIFENENAGFQLAKKVLGGLQARSLPAISAKELIGGVTGVLAMAWQFLVRSRLYIGPETPTHLQLDVEQQPNVENRIRLGDQRDAWGRPIAVVQWQVRAEDEEAIRSTTRRLLALWPGPQIGFPELRQVKDVASGQNKPYDAYHPVGTCRMGQNGDSVVDPGLKVHGTSNLSVLSTAVFPTAGTANPTFSMLCLGEALADDLRRSA